MSEPFATRWRRTFARSRHGKIDGLTPTAVCVGFLLCEYGDWDTGANIRPGHRRIADTIGTTPATVKRSVSALVRSGWVDLEAHGSYGRASTYRLSIPSLVHPVTGTVTVPVTGTPVIPLRKRAVTRNGVTGVRLTGTPVTPHLYRPIGRALASAA